MSAWYYFDVNGNEELCYEALALLPGAGSEILTEGRAKLSVPLDPRELENTVKFISSLGLSVSAYGPIADKNWVQEHEEILAPLTIGALTILPVRGTEAGPSASKNELRIIPGMGFGTGHHPTTSMLIELMQTPHVHEGNPCVTLDVGTGSGILALAASALELGQIKGFDNDPYAIENAKDNLSLNPLLWGITFEVAEAINETSRADLLIANIYAEILSELEPQFHRQLGKKGLLLISGIMESKITLIKAAFHKERWQFTMERIREGWAAYLLTKV